MGRPSLGGNVDQALSAGLVAQSLGFAPPPAPEPTPEDRKPDPGLVTALFGEKAE